MRAEPGTWRLVLIASLALNLFVATAAATAWLAGFGWLPFLHAADRPGRLVGMPNPRQLRAALGERHQAAVDEALRAHGPEIRQRVRDLGAARAAVAEAIRAEPFDRAALEAALARLREREGAVATATQGMMVELVSRLDADGRGRVAELVPFRRPPRAR